MIDKRMIIDPDHLSVLARKQLLPILEQRKYSGVVSSHSWSTVDAFPRIYKLGGMITPVRGRLDVVRRGVEEDQADARPALLLRASATART